MKKISLSIKYPQNYIIKNPLQGSAVLFVFSFLFALIYHPLNTHESFFFGFELTMFVYTLATAIASILLILILKKVPFFSETEKWTLGKELLSIYLLLQFMGVVIFLLGFLIESPSLESRWNLPTLLDSCKHTFLIYIFPFVFFSAASYKFLFLNFESTIKHFQDEKKLQLRVDIRSRLKKESLSFLANELLFAVSEGNYVVFHLLQEQKIKKIPIRNSISEIEKQLQDIPFFFRCHKGFIVNLNRVKSKKGNSSGYLLKIQHCEDTLPVSRKNTRQFDQRMQAPAR